MTDLARISFIVKTPQEGDAVTRALARSFVVEDRGFRVVYGGYFDRKVLVRDRQGMVGEVQIIPEPIFRAKQSGGHDLYKETSVLPKGQEKRNLEKQQNALYSAVRAELGEEWKDLLSRPKKLK